MIEAILRDCMHAFRLLLKSPGFTIVAISMIGLGVGANTAIFSFVNALILRPPASLNQPENLVQVLRTADRVSDRVSYPDCRDYQEHNSTLSGVGMHWRTNLHANFGGEAVRLNGALVSGGYFDVLGVIPALGRLIVRSDAETEGSEAVAVVSHSLWSSHFNRDRDVLGQTLELNGLVYTVVGVAPPGFAGVVTGERTDLWVPLTMWRHADPGMARSAETWSVDWFGDRDATWLMAFARLKPGVTIEQARADLSAIAQRLARDYPLTNQDVGVNLEPGLGLPPHLRGRVRDFVRLPVAVVGLVLLLVCANLSGVMLTKARARRKEFGIRLALGAGRGRLLRQLFTESLLLALAGGAVGLLIGLWLSRWLRTSLPGTYLSMPLDLDIALDERVLLVTLGLSLFTCVLIGLAPALQTSRLDPVSLLKEGPGDGRGGKTLLRGVLVVAQIALSVVLVGAAGLLIRTLESARGVETGFDIRRVLTARVDLGRQNYTESEGQAFYRSLIERMASVPEVRSASLALNVPLSGPQAVTRIHPEGRPTETGPLQVSFNIITPGYFETVGIPLLRGRDFSTSDDQYSPRVAVVNETLARHYWPGEDALGRHFRFAENKPENPLIEIIGIASDTKVGGLFTSPRMYVYMPLAQRYQDRQIVHLQTQGEPETLIPAIRREIAALDAALPVYEVKTLSSYVEDALTPQRLAASLIGGFGLLALILAAIGLYGSLSHYVSQRTKEIGIRMALGAEPRHLLLLVVGRGMGLTLIGVGVGLIAALALTRLIEGLLFGVSASDPATFAVTGALLAAAGMLASYLPARRAIRVDPARSLRYE